MIANHSATGTSSFGYTGTNAHVLLAGCANEDCSLLDAYQVVVFQHTQFSFCEEVKTVDKEASPNECIYLIRWEQQWGLSNPSVDQSNLLIVGSSKHLRSDYTGNKHPVCTIKEATETLCSSAEQPTNIVYLGSLNTEQSPEATICEVGTLIRLRQEKISSLVVATSLVEGPDATRFETAALWGIARSVSLEQNGAPVVCVDTKDTSISLSEVLHLTESVVRGNKMFVPRLHRVQCLDCVVQKSEIPRGTCVISGSSALVMLVAEHMLSTASPSSSA